MFSGLEFRHLSFFVAVAEECSFTRAAKRLHTSQPALSQGIKQLEDGLTATLFVRGPAGTGLSPAGAAFLPFARDLLLRRDEAAQMAAAVHHGRDVPFRFGYSPFVSRGLVREAQSAYAELVPSGSIEQSSDGSAALVKMVSERRLDAGAVICLGSLIFAGIKMMSGNFQQAIPGLFGALFGAGVLGWGAGWIGSLTGQSM